MDFGPGGAEVIHAGRERGRADAVVEAHTADLSPSRPPAIAASSEQVTDVGQKWRLADAAGDQGNVVAAVKFGEAVSQRPTYCQPVARPRFGEPPRHFADNETN